MAFEEYLKSKYNFNEPIYIDEIRFENYSRSWIYMQIKKLVESGILKRFDAGIYYFPLKMSFGDTCLDPREVVRKRYLSDGDEVYGYLAGLSMKNAAGLSTQCPNMLELVSNNESARVRDIKIGSQRVRARRSRTSITKENVAVLQFLDLMNVTNFRFMDDNERYMLKRYIRDSGVTLDQIEQYAGFFPAKATRSLMESGVVNELT